MFKEFGQTLILEGTACLGKTTVLQRLAGEGFSVVVGDYAEDCIQYNVFRDKDLNNVLELAYMLFQFSKLKPNTLHDRGPLSSLAYRMVHDILNRRHSLQDFEILFAQLPAQLWNTFRQLNTFMVVEHDIKGGLQRMILRNNGIDVMSEEYIDVQNRVFEFLANYTGAKVIVHKQGESMEEWINALCEVIRTTLLNDLREEE
ncbi:AAA domain protein [Gregarina niphandrodes]|uniref:AAA domain protein n=1 Tax=Gregarina niphandrodes TaxID=110365 RepID=A0A023AXF1_GRENI|nr:AAA domain protein [Gregarina niphandrodes]EZG42930.1 AAA domain protein [Gregarina niphandrodes]|eukprot:XP_011133794.1 AAA domain protein [Gregarina niphandrodes]